LLAKFEPSQKNLDNVRKKVYAFRPRRSPWRTDRQAAGFLETIASQSGLKGKMKPTIGKPGGGKRTIFLEK
jgi:hypothetical protein